MRKRQQNKPLYIGIATAVLLLFLIIGGWLYNSSPRSAKKDDSTTNTPQPSLPSGDKSTISPNPDPHPPHSVSIITVHNVLFFGIFMWLSTQYAAQLNQNAKPPLKLSTLDYTLIAMGTIAIMVYIIHFFKQMYIAHKVPVDVLLLDIGFFAALSLLTSVVSMFDFFGKLQGGLGNLQRPLLAKIGIGCLVNLLAYLVAINVITYFKSNDKITLAQQIDRVGLCAIVILTGIWSFIVKALPTSPVYLRLLWAIPSCFLYVKAFWDPVIPTIGHPKIDTILALLLEPNHLWEGLVVVLAIYHLEYPEWPTLRWWLVWALWKWGGFYHLKIKKDTDTAANTVNLPLVLEEAFLILFGVYRPLHVKFEADYFNTLSARALCLSFFLIAGLWIKKLYFSDSKKPWVQWGGHIAYALLIISGFIAANAYRQKNRDKTRNIILGGGSLLVLALYFTPKCLNRIATAALAYKNTYPWVETIALKLQMSTAFWLQFSRKDIAHIGVFSALLSVIYKHSTPTAYILRFAGICFAYTLVIAYCWRILSIMVGDWKPLKPLRDSLEKWPYVLAVAWTIYAAYKHKR